jgi:ribosome biogenesis GTPase
VRPGARLISDTAPESGLVVAAHGRHCAVEVADGRILTCTTRGKRSSVVCGDRVDVLRVSNDQGVIESVSQRTSVLFRSDAHREKLFAANVTQVVVVVAPWPVFSHDLLVRCLVGAEHAGAQSVVVLNKIDLPEARAVREQLARYPEIGYEVLPLAAKQDVAPLLPRLEGHTSVLVGESGMGKSTLINRLLPAARAATAEVSLSLAAGRHTTTDTRLYHLNPRSRIIDAPGIKVFGLHHVDPADLARAFPDFRPWLGQCRFANCRHLREPDCAVDQAARDGEVAAARLQAYRRLLEETQRR